MLHPFVSARPVRARSLGETSLSVLLHAGLLAAVVAAAGEPALRSLPASAIAVERLVFVGPTTLLRTATPAALRRVRKAASRARATREQAETPLRLTFAPVPVPALPEEAIPEVDAVLDLDGALAAPGAFEGAGTRSVIEAVLGRLVPPAPDRRGAYSQFVVEKVVSPRAGNPTPRYPMALLGARVEGSFHVTFVVDSTGRVDEESIEVPPEAHPLFAAAVRRALLRSRYLPAELEGRRVRQHVEQQFTFRIGG